MIEVTNLCKSYGGRAAVSDLSFTVEDGQIYGFLGPNGAGKSTTMNILTGCLAATSGRVLIDGKDIFEDAREAKAKIGYLPEQPPLFPDMTPREYLSFVAAAKKIKKEERKALIDEVMEITKIKSEENRLIKNLSKGYRQRVGIAQAILGNPSIIILDEPTVGLDPLQIIEIRSLIKKLGEKHTVILSSHILSEVQAVCDKIMIISHGRLAACDTPSNLEALFKGENKVELTVRAGAEDVNGALSGVEEIKDIKLTPKDNGITEAEITVSGDADIREKVFFAFCGIGRPILKMVSKRASLEDVFIELTAESGGENV